jgi:hypothetical protein
MTDQESAFLRGLDRGADHAPDDDLAAARLSLRDAIAQMPDGAERARELARESLQLLHAEEAER